MKIKNKYQQFTSLWQKLEKNYQKLIHSLQYAPFIDSAEKNMLSKISQYEDEFHSMKLGYGYNEEILEEGIKALSWLEDMIERDWIGLLDWEIEEYWQNKWRNEPDYQF